MDHREDPERSNSTTSNDEVAQAPVDTDDAWLSDELEDEDDEGGVRDDPDVDGIELEGEPTDVTVEASHTAGMGSDLLGPQVTGAAHVAGWSKNETDHIASG